MKHSANEQNKIRLQVFLSHHGICSRRKAMDLVKEGKVSVNGRIVLEPSTPVDVNKDEIFFENKKVGVKTYDYVLLYKPQGYTTTLEDPFAEKLVLELIPENLKHVKPVGRLDKNTEGLLLLTNDGNVAHKLTHPSFHIDKIYLVEIKGVLRNEDKEHLEKGVVFKGRKSAACKIFDIKKDKDRTTLRIAIHEGRKRQVREMFGALKYPVVFLKREQQGPLKVGSLKPGEFRLLTASEITVLKNL